MIGLRVELPVDHANYISGLIIKYDEESGRIQVRDDEGVDWYGYEYQTTLIDSQ